MLSLTYTLRRTIGITVVAFMTGAVQASDRFVPYWIGPPGEGFVLTSSPTGDVNGDGMEDLVLVTKGGSPTSPQHVFVRSGANGSLLHTWLPSLPGYWAAKPSRQPAGDLDLDGFDDVATTIVNTSGGSFHMVEIHSGHDGSVMAVIPPPFTPPSVLGINLVGMGDLDGDTWPELLIVGMHQAVQCMAVYNFEAPAFGLQSFFGNPQCGSLFGVALGRLDDVDGDGVVDFYVGAPQAFGGFVFGGWIGVYSGATASLIASQFGNGFGQDLGSSVAALSDVTGDGMPELAALRFAGSPGNDVRVFSLPSFTEVYTITSAAVGAYGFAEVDAVGDIDGDGLDDFLARFVTTLGDVVTAHSGPTGGIVGQIAQGYVGGVFTPFGGLGDVNGDGLGDFAVTPQTQITMLPPFVAQSLWSPWSFPMTSGQVMVLVSRNLDVAGAASVGGAATFDVVAPRRAGRIYQIVLSRDFVFPGVPLGPFLFPVALDSLFWASFSAGIGGILDATGHGTVTVPIPNVSALQGQVVHASGVVYDPAGPLGIGCVLTHLPVQIQ